MKELIKINTYNEKRPTVLGRDLHKFLEIKTRYNDWFERMLEYGFEYGQDYTDFYSKMSKTNIGRPDINHQLTLDTAKEIAMIQRNEKGKQIRKYFLKCEEILKDIIFQKNNNVGSEDWQKVRKETKSIRLEETNTIKNLVEYAKKSGSKNAEKYYILYSNLIWKYLFDVKIKCKEKRDILNASQLHLLSQGEYIVKNCIDEGLKDKADYHDIFDNTKNKLKDFAKFVEITRVPYYSQISMI